MRVLFDAYWWAEGPTALRHVLRETILQWRASHPQDILGLVVRKRHFHQIKSELGDGVELFPSVLRPQALFAMVAVGIFARSFQADAVLTQNFTARTSCISATFLHDVMFIEHPYWFTLAERIYFRGMPLSVRGADIVLTSSQSEASRIRRLTQARTVIPVGIGISEELLSAPQVAVPDVDPNSFALIVGRLNTRKNVVSAIEAAAIAQSITPDRPLLIAGTQNGKAETRSLSSRAGTALQEGRIRLLGHVTDGQLAWLYANASVYLNCSLDEGFGMPLVEAAAFGAPAVVSDIPVFREVAAEGARFVDPRSILSISLALDQTLDESLSLRRENTISAYTWPLIVPKMRRALTSLKEMHD